MCDERSVGDEVDGRNGDGAPDVTGQRNRGATGRVDVVSRIDAFYATGCIVAFEAPASASAIASDALQRMMVGGLSFMCARMRPRTAPRPMPTGSSTQGVLRFAEDGRGAASSPRGREAACPR